MRRAPQCNTLDAAGWTYNPYTGLDVFGAPSPLMLTALEQHELPLGGGLPAVSALADPKLRNGEPRLGSDSASQWKGVPKDDASTFALVAFIGILALALYMRLPGSP